MDNALEATCEDMEGWGYKEKSKEEDGIHCWVDAINWEAFETQEVPVLPEHSMADWEAMHCQDPDTGHWKEKEEAAWVHQEETRGKVAGEAAQGTMPVEEATGNVLGNTKANENKN